MTRFCAPACVVWGTWSNLVAGAIDSVHTVFGVLLDVALWPGTSLPSGWQWVWASLLSGAALALLWRRLQSSRRLEVLASQAWAGLLAVWLFRHEPGAAARAQVDALRANLVLLFWSLLPVAASFLLAFPFLIQLQARYGYQWLHPGDTLIVRFDCTDADTANRVQVDWPGTAGTVEAVVREPAVSAVVARLGVRESGHHHVLASASGRPVPVPVSVDLPPRAVMLGGEWGERLLYPGGQPLSKRSGLTRITLAYEPVSWRRWLLFGCANCVGALTALAMCRLRAGRRDPEDQASGM